MSHEPWSTLTRVGSSLVKFRGEGFWVGDTVLCFWLHLLAERIDQLSARPTWVDDARDRWRGWARSGAIGCIDPELDQILSTSERLALAQSLTREAMAWLRAQDSPLRKERLNSLGVGGPGSFFTRDVDVDVFVPAGEALLRLLHGELETNHGKTY